MGDIPRSESTAVITGQLARFAASLVADYDACCVAASSIDLLRNLKPLVEDTEKLVYWLGFLQDSKTFNHSDLAALLDRSKKLSTVFKTHLQTLQTKK